MLFLQDKVAVVTGAADGMGKAIALFFIQNGAKVILTDINEEKLKNLQLQLGEKSCYYIVDITKLTEIEVMVSEVLSKESKIDILVNCAGGVLSPTGSSATMNMSTDWQPIIDLNLTGTMNVIMTILPSMKAKKSGKIINLSSIGALNPYVTVLHYHAAKAGIESITKNLAFELAPYNIHVNTISSWANINQFLG